MGITLTSRTFRKFKKVTLEFLQEIIETELENDFRPCDDDYVEEPKLHKTKKKVSVSSSQYEESKARPAPKAVQLKTSEESDAYFIILDVFKHSGLPLPRTELTEARTPAAKIAVLETAMRKAGLEGVISIENATKLREIKSKK